MRRGVSLVFVLAAASAFGLLVAHASVQSTAQSGQSRAARTGAASYGWSTFSSPISISADGRLVWVVNPDSNSVSVIRTDNDTVLRERPVGREPRSVALDPRNQRAYVANAADGTVSVVRIDNASFAHWSARIEKTLVTGAEPSNIVISPNGKRIFVANSGQDTITVIKSGKPKIIGQVDLRHSLCNNPDRNRHFQPRGLAVTQNNRYLYVTSFFAFTKPGGIQGTDTGREAAVCRLTINTNSSRIKDYRPTARIALGPQVTGFKVDSTGDGVPDDTSAFPNQLQSIVIRGNDAYLPSIAASPSGPLRFNVDTQAFVSVIDGPNGGTQTDNSATEGLNLHLGARDPEPGKKKLFFANLWAIGFTNQTGDGHAYGVSSGSDLLVKLNVAPAGKLSFTVDGDTTRYIDLNDPSNPATSGDNAGKNPQGIVINRAGTKAYVQNVVSRNVSVVDLTNDRVVKTIRTRGLPAPGSDAEKVLAGQEVFFSSRGRFNRPAGTSVSTPERLSQDGWQACSSCHFAGLTDSVVWTFNAGPRKSIPLNGTFNPHNGSDQKVLNYSAIFDEVQDFEANIRNVSGPGPLAAAVPCATGTTTLDPNHGLLIGDNGDINDPPCALNAFALANAGRHQLTITLPGSTTQIPALDALADWVRFGIRTPSGPFPGKKLKGASAAQIRQGRTLFQQQHCQDCHAGPKWTIATKDFTSPPAGAEIATERNPAPTFGNPVGAQYLFRFLRDIGSFNLGVAGGNNPLGNNIGAPEKATQTIVNGAAVAGQDALGTDYNGDGKGVGFAPQSLLGIYASPPYYHNGACETLACVVGNFKHRTANGRLTDHLGNQPDQAKVVAFLESISARTPPFRRR